MKDNFAASLAAVLVDEGGNDDDPADHGGRTSRGITQREYNAWRAEGALPQRDVWQATKQEIEQIYRSEYWDPFCDDFPPGIDYLYFDFAVNAGPARAAKTLQRALGVIADGRIGPITRQAIKAVDPLALISRFSNSKRDFYRNLHQPRFLNGWLNRVNHVQQVAMQMARKGAV